MEQLKSNGSREAWVDILRGLAVFMVILGHLYSGYVYHLLVNPVKMPMFYFLAGYVFKPNMSLGGLIANRMKTLFIPLFVFSLFPIRALYYLLVLRDTLVFTDYVVGFSDGSINWFICSFFVSSILFGWINQLAKGKPLYFGIVSACCLTIGILTRDIALMDFWCMNTALTGVFYMWLGYAFRAYQSRFENLKWLVPLCALVYAALLWVSYTFYNGRSINYHLCKYYNIPICLGLIVSGILLMQKASVKYCRFFEGRVKKSLAVFGQHTLVVYLFSSTSTSVVLTAFGRILRTASSGFIACLIEAVFICTIGCLLSMGCKKYAPFLLGLRAENTKKE